MLAVDTLYTAFYEEVGYEHHWDMSIEGNEGKGLIGRKASLGAMWLGLVME